LKELLILRHAKSSWRHAGLDDRDRPLNKRGMRDAPRMGRFLAAEGLVPERIVASPARRARQTAQRLAEACGCAGALTWSDRLYQADPDTILDVLADLPDGPTRVLVIAHNPGLEDLLEQLIGRPEILPTAALAHVEIDIEHWTDLRSETGGRLLGIWRPKEMPSEP